METTTTATFNQAEENRVLDPEVIKRGLDAVADTYRGYKVADLRAVFNAVCDPDDWKAPITIKAVERRYVGLFADAVVFMTASPVKVLAQRGDEFDLYSDGYRLGPAN